MRLIDADVVKEHFLNGGEDYYSGYAVHYVIDHTPTVDAVPVVRCKDCKWYQESKLLAPTKFCFRLEGKDGEKVGYNFADDDFCSHGERKGGVNDDHNEMGQNCTIAETM